MDDKMIVDLFLERSETAIAETTLKYGKYLRHIAYRILENEQDGEEIENDTYRKLWESIPPQKPNSLKAYLAKIGRNLAINRLEERQAQKRRSESNLVLDELSECLPDRSETGDLCDSFALRTALDSFLAGLDTDTRVIFMQRYFYTCSLRDIAQRHGMKESAISMLLFRTRQKLKEHLVKEGIEL